MSLMLGSSIRFIFPSPRVWEFVAAAILLFNSSLYFASYACPRDFHYHFCVAD